MSVRAADVIGFAQQQLGKPYETNATSSNHNSFDCSSLVQYVYGHFGISLPRVTFDQVRTGRAVPRGSQQPGDLIFSDWGEGPNSHVALYIGGGKVIEAPQPGENVMISSYSGNYLSHTTNIRRVIDSNGNPLDLTGVNTIPINNNRHPNDGPLNGPMPNPQTPKSLYEQFTDPDSSSSITSIFADIDKSFQAVAEVADWVHKITYPPTMIRIGAGFWGAVFILLGLFVIIGEARDA